MRPIDLLSGEDARFDISTLNFPSPWSARAFGIVLAAAERGILSLREFQEKLIEEIGRHEKDHSIDNEEIYYSRWISALMNLLEEKGLITHEKLCNAEGVISSHIEAVKHEHAKSHGFDNANPQPKFKDMGK